jgi:hypothetical protein
MSAGTTSLVRRFYEAFSAGDLETLTDWLGMLQRLGLVLPPPPAGAGERR